MNKNSIFMVLVSIAAFPTLLDGMGSGKNGKHSSRHEEEILAILQAHKTSHV